MQIRLIYLAVFTILLGVLFVVLAEATALSSCTCPIPGAESTDPYGDLSNSSEVIEYFEQTLYNSPSNPAGYPVEETPGTVEGTNSCWFSGSDISQHPQIPDGTSWVVTDQDEWGPDEVGLTDQDAEQIWDEYVDGNLILPCGVDTYQTMEIECSPNDYTEYEQNVPQTRTIDQSHALKACRDTECGGEIPIY